MARFRQGCRRPARPAAPVTTRACHQRASPDPMPHLTTPRHPRRHGVSEQTTHTWLVIRFGWRWAPDRTMHQDSDHRHIEQATGQDDAGLPGLANGKVQARVRR